MQNIDEWQWDIPLNPALGSQSQADCYKFKASLGCMVEFQVSLSYRATCLYK